METNNEERKRLVNEIKDKEWFISNPNAIAGYILYKVESIVAEQYELSEEELEVLLNNILIGDFKSDERYIGTEACKHIAQAIIQNKSKIFVRKTK